LSHAARLAGGTAVAAIARRARAASSKASMQRCYPVLPGQSRYEIAPALILHHVQYAQRPHQPGAMAARSRGID
jgi:hypothetical protein